MELRGIEIPADLKADRSAWREQWVPDLTLIRVTTEEFFKRRFLGPFTNDVASASLGYGLRICHISCFHVIVMLDRV